MNKAQAESFTRDVLKYATDEAKRRGVTAHVNVTVSCTVVSTTTHDMHEEVEQ